MPVQLSCVICQSVFSVSPSMVDRYKTCSPDCRKQYTSRRRNGLNTGKAEIRRCVVCGESFRFTLSRKQLSGECCSRNCAKQRCRARLDEEQIIKLYQSGLSIYEIGDLFGVSGATIQYRLKVNNVPRRSASERIAANNPMKGKTHTAEARQKIREANARQFADPANREKHAIAAAQQIAEGRTGKSHNKLEARFAEILQDSDQKFTTQHRIGRYVFDFYIPAHNLLIETDGGFWHGDPRSYPDRDNLSPIQIKNIENDRRKNAIAVERGYKLIRFWEADVKNAPDVVRAAVIQACNYAE